MSQSFFRTILILPLAFGFVAPASAQYLEGRVGEVYPDAPPPPPPRGYDDPRDDRRGPPPPPSRGISEREAVRIARGEGMREIDDVSRQRRSIRVDGGDRRGDDMTVIIDARSGDVIDVR